jgi:tRNA-dihydrouridine synthase B
LPVAISAPSRYNPPVMAAVAAPLASTLRRYPVVLAPMEDVTDASYRALCRSMGAELCVTEFIGAEQMIAGSRLAKRRATLAAGDQPTAIQIYGADPTALVRAAEIAERAAPVFLDINCGCWVPRIAGRGAGAGWLRNPTAMIEMAGRVVRAVGLPVTVKTRIGWGPESDMPIIDLARRLEDVGISGLTIHCRTAAMGHSGRADWQWARRAREVVQIPVIVNGDVASVDDVVRSLAETGCAGSMIGRAAIEDPWIFAEAREVLAGRPCPPRPTDAERLAVFRRVLLENVAVRGELRGVACTRRHLGLLGPALRPRLRPLLFSTMELAASLDILDRASDGNLAEPAAAVLAAPSLARAAT